MAYPTPPGGKNNNKDQTGKDKETNKPRRHCEKVTPERQANIIGPEATKIANKTMKTAASLASGVNLQIIEDAMSTETKRKKKQ